MHNDFRRERGIFPLFDGMSAPGLDTHVTTGDNAHLSGVPHVNGSSTANADADEQKEASAYDAAKITKNEHLDSTKQSLIASDPSELKN